MVIGGIGWFVWKTMYRDNNKTPTTQSEKILVQKWKASPMLFKGLIILFGLGVIASVFDEKKSPLPQASASPQVSEKLKQMPPSEHLSNAKKSIESKNSVPSSWSITDIDGLVDRGVKKVPVNYNSSCNGAFVLQKATYKLDVRNKNRMSRSLTHGEGPADFFITLKKVSKSTKNLTVTLQLPNAKKGTFDIKGKSGNYYFDTSDLVIPKFWYKLDVECY